MTLLTTDRLELRPWTEADLSAFYDLYSRWEVMRWLGPEPRRALRTQDEAQARLRTWQGRHAAVSPPLGLWAVVPQSGHTRRPVGTALLLPLADAGGPTSEVEVGWHLHPDWQGRGLATQAGAHLLAAAASAGHRRVRAVTDPSNTASQAVALRLGMRDAGLTDRWFGLVLREFIWTQPGPDEDDP